MRGREDIGFILLHAARRRGIGWFPVWLGVLPSLFLAGCEGNGPVTDFGKVATRAGIKLPQSAGNVRLETRTTWNYFAFLRFDLPERALSELARDNPRLPPLIDGERSAQIEKHMSMNAIGRELSWWHPERVRPSFSAESSGVREDADGDASKWSYSVIGAPDDGGRVRLHIMAVVQPWRSTAGEA